MLGESQDGGLSQRRRQIGQPHSCYELSSPSGPWPRLLTETELRDRSAVPNYNAAFGAITLVWP